MTRGRRTNDPPGRWTSLAALVAANGVLLAPLPPEIRVFGALALFVALPGYLLVETVFNGERPSGLERGLLAVGCGYVLAVLLALVLYAVFRPLHTVHVVAGANALNGLLLFGALARRREARASILMPRIGRPGWPALAALTVLVVAAPFRLLNLGYSEFQGDEALVLLRTLAVVQGVPDALIAHRKPPGEILLNATFAAGLGSITEANARLPFALAGLAGVLALFRLGRAFFGTSAGLVAGLLLAVNGYFVTFGRIVQYQSVGFLLDTLAILCLFRFARGARARRGYAVVGALLLAGAAFMGLNAVFLLPVAAVALWPSLVGPKRAPWRELAVWLWPLGLLLPILAATYFVLPRDTPDTLDLTRAWGYLGPRLGGNRPYFNLERFLLSANHYTSSLYLLVVLGGGVLVLLEPLYERCRGLADRLSPSRGRPQAALAALALDVPKIGPPVLFAAVFGLLLSSARRSAGWKIALTWMAVPLFTHLFLIRVPGTHWREAIPGLLLLVGAAAGGLFARLESPRLRLTAVVAGGLFLVTIGHYVYEAWLRPWPEYQLEYPLYRHPLDWTNLEIRSAGGTFGAARRHGWKAVAELVAAGELPAEYTTNERPAEAAWYLKTSWLCDEAARLFVRSPRFLQDRRAIENGEALPGYTLAARVEVGGRPTLSLLTRESSPGSPRVYRAEEFGERFNRQLASPWTPIGRLYRPGLNSGPLCPPNT